ncbi:MAG: citrate synthase [Firmicutes bacterium]|nr:citrate synthase [Bacillota bacterium]
MPESTFKAGLEDVVAGESSICLIDEKDSRLIYYGYDVYDLVEHCSFEEVIYLLHHGELPTQAQLDDFTAQLNQERSVDEAVLDLIRHAPLTAHPMETLRTAVSALSFYDREANEMTQESNLRKAIRLVAKMGTLVAAIGRTRAGQAPVAPRGDLSTAANFLYMLTGEAPDDLAEQTLNIALILHADHEFNASTFAARVTAGTLSDIYSAITSAVGALKGPLHGGANEQVMHMLMEIGTPEKAERWVREALAQKKKIMGFGHRVYKHSDPRAEYLKQYAKKVGEAYGQTQWFTLQEEVRRTVEQQRGLHPNVDFYSATTYYVLGVPIELFTPLFAVSRIAGWTAHVLEQYANNRIIRPVASYIGPQPRSFVALKDRR